MVIKNLLLNDRLTDINVQEGIITKIANGIEGEPFFDAKGARAICAFSDINIKPLSNALSEKAFLDLNARASKNGFARVVLNPDTTPSVASEIRIEFLNSFAKTLKGTQLLTNLLAIAEDKLSDISILLKKGALSAYVNSDENAFMLLMVFEYMKFRNKRLFVNANNRAISDIGVMHDGEVCAQLGLYGIDEVCESMEVAKILELAQSSGVEVVFGALSSARSVEMISQTSSHTTVSLHHLLLDDRACEGYNTLAKLMPPLRDKENRAKLRQQLKEKKIDILTSADASFKMIDKDLSFASALYGVDGLSNYLSLIYTHLIATDIIDFEDLNRLTNINPSHLLDLEPIVIKEGAVANFVLFNENIERQIDNSASLYHTQKVKGEIVMAMINGEIME